MEVGELTALTPVVAQMVERRSHIPGVGGSSPPYGTSIIFMIKEC